jgi:hypothetical protein
MPKLSRMRLVSIGHPRARFDDLLLDFRDDQGRATDSVLWLRNGGGKSSLLNLFYSIVRPRQTDFLGGKGGEEHRRLTDYVQADDRAIIACEWQLDGDNVLFDGEPLRYLTIIFHEHRASSPTEGPSAGLQRLFLAAESRPDVPELTLEGIPLTTASEDGRTMRRSLSNFRKEWRNLQEKHPDRDVFVTDKQMDWTRQLESRGIDTHLFGYQLHMNSREGGVTELFTFSDADSFVDFLLNTAFDPQDAENVQEQVSTFRTELLRRQTELQPDRELCQGLLNRLEPFSTVAESRSEVRQQLSRFRDSCASLRSSLEHLRTQADAKREDHEVQFEQFSATATDKLKAAERLTDFALSLRHHALTMRLETAEAEQAQRRTEMDAAAVQEELWTAAVPLARALEYETKAREHREQLRSREATHAPLFRRLAEAASLFAATLRSERGRLDAEADKKKSEAHRHKEESRRTRDAATECARDEASAKTKADEIDTRLQTAEARWNRLVADDVVLETERSDESHVAVSRLAAESSCINAKIRELKATESDLQRRLDTLAGERGDFQLSINEKKMLLSGVEREIETKQSAENALATNHTLLAMLQTESVDPDKVCTEALRLGREEVRRAQEAMLQLRLERADDEWATEYLSEHGRLPPTRDTLNMLEWFREKGGSCWSGWEYLEENVAPEKRRSVIARSSRLVSGVVVHDESSLELLRESDSLPNLAGPVAVGMGQQLLEGETDAACVVVGPSGDAMFDQSAAGRAEAEMARRIAQSKQEEGEKNHWHDAVSQLVNQLAQYIATYPASWLNDRLTRRDQLRHEIGEIQGRIEEMIAEDIQLKQEQAELNTCREALVDQEKGLDLAHQRALDFSEQYGQNLAAWGRDRVALRQEESRCQARQRKLAKRAGQAELLASSLEAESQQLVTRALLLQDEESRIRHTEADVRLSSAVSLELARKSYQALLNEYNSKVGAETLEQLAIECDREAEAAHRRFGAVRKAHIDKDMVFQAIQAMEPEATAEETKDRAKDAHWEAKQALGQASTRINLIRKRLDDVAQELSSRPEGDRCGNVSPELSPEDAEEQAAQADAHAAEARSEGQLAEKQASECKQQANRLEATLEKLSGLKDRLQDLSTTHADLMQHAQEDMTDVAEEGTVAPMEDVANCQSAINRLASGLIAAKRKWYDLDAAAEQAVKAVHDWCRNDRFASLRDGVAARFIQFGAIDIENRLAYFREHLSTRLEQIDADLAEADKQRDVVVDAAMSAVTQALELLARIARLSRLPDSVPGGGRYFLDIDTNAPENPAERRARVAELIDEVIESGSVENGLELVQRATRRVARPLRVRVLHPDLDSSGTRVSIHQMANFSGGERLTGAILLYCALARLRGQQLGITKKRTSVLLLDNPIGTVSRVRYLDLQREVARALGVQLIYATGVHDIDAIASLPNVIRLQNSRRDIRRGRRVVELETSGSSETPSIVDAARVHTASRHTGNSAVSSRGSEFHQAGAVDADDR